MIEKAYELAKKKYKEFNIDTDKVLELIENISISLHCWQGDDVGGFERPDAELGGGGIVATGGFPGKARNVEELRQDYEKVLSLLPGNYRINLHSIYGEFGRENVERDQIEPKYFQGWINWAKKNDVKIDFNATLFSHPKAEAGFTLSSKDPEIRDFWIRHCKKAREIAAYIGKELNSPCIYNIWIPDGMKDLTIDRYGHRQLLKESLDEIFKEKINKNHVKDSVEGKLFGIGSEAFVVGSHEFYLSYAMKKNIMLCLDMGHFHPTENVGEKIPAILPFIEELLIHVSRGVRWDSDHVVIVNEDLLSLAHEIVRAKALDRIHLGLDFFDASINRIGAYVIGARATLKTFLIALLEPLDLLKEAEESGNYFKRLSLLEEMKTMPYGAVWDYYCKKKGVLIGTSWIEEVLKYERDVLRMRI